MYCIMDVSNALLPNYMFRRFKSRRIVSASLAVVCFKVQLVAIKSNKRTNTETMAKRCIKSEHSEVTDPRFTSMYKRAYF